MYHIERASCLSWKAKALINTGLREGSGKEIYWKILARNTKDWRRDGMIDQARVPTPPLPVNEQDITLSLSLAHLYKCTCSSPLLLTAAPSHSRRDSLKKPTWAQIPRRNRDMASRVAALFLLVVVCTGFAAGKRYLHAETTLAVLLEQGMHDKYKGKSCRRNSR